VILLTRAPSFAFDFSRADRVTWKQGSEGRVEPIEAPLGFCVDDSAIADEFASQLPTCLADLVDIGVAAHTARRSLQYAGNWSRRIELTLCTRCPETLVW
jgi:hypothetical protein